MKAWSRPQATRVTNHAQSMRYTEGKLLTFENGDNLINDHVLPCCANKARHGGRCGTGLVDLKQLLHFVQTLQEPSGRVSTTAAS
jgi:hypothetical protein